MLISVILIPDRHLYLLNSVKPTKVMSIRNQQGLSGKGVSKQEDL
jgi:hypothetical protein